MEEPRYLNEYINQMLYDMGQIGPQHLNAMRIGLSAFYKRIRYVDISADLNENVIEFAIKFRWWAFFLPKKKFLRRIKKMIVYSLPKPVKIIDVEDNGQPVVQQTDYEVRVGILGGEDRVKWVDDDKKESRKDSRKVENKTD